MIAGATAGSTSLKIFGAASMLRSSSRLTLGLSGRTTALLKARPLCTAPQRGVVRIGTVSTPLGPPPQRPSLVPRPSTLRSTDANASNDHSSALATVQWLMKKSALKQDAILLGSHPAYMRSLVFRWAAELEREVECISITRDTTESDLKQRRELTGGSVLYVNQPVVEAALHGRVLVIEGLEKAERNL